MKTFVSLLALVSVGSFAQTSVPCPEYVGLQATGCTAFGHTGDEDVRSWAITFVSATSHANTNFCNDLWGFTLDWLNFMTGAFESATLDGTEKEALSAYDDGWIDGWLDEDRLRGTGSTSDRGWWLNNIALHEGAHRACDESDWVAVTPAMRMKSTVR